MITKLSQIFKKNHNSSEVEIAHKVNELVDASNASTPSYKVYTALLTQSGTNAPVATVLENTLGIVPVWSYDEVGYYILTASGAFTDTKTFITVDYNRYGSTGGLGGGTYRSAYSYKDDGETNFIWLETQNITQGASALEFTAANDVVDGYIRIKIEVYN